MHTPTDSNCREFSVPNKSTYRPGGPTKVHSCLWQCKESFHWFHVHIHWNLVACVITKGLTPWFIPWEWLVVSFFLSMSSMSHWLRSSCGNRLWNHGCRSVSFLPSLDNHSHNPTSVDPSRQDSSGVVVGYPFQFIRSRFFVSPCWSKFSTIGLYLGLQGQPLYPLMMP